MELKYDVTDDGKIINAHFDGLAGLESVSSLKQALELLQVDNPAIIFTRAVKSGLYDHIPDKEYYKLLDIVDTISVLWRYEGDQPEGKSTQPSLNPLILLANAITMIGQLHAQLRQAPPGTVHPGGKGV